MGAVLRLSSQFAPQEDPVALLSLLPLARLRFVHASAAGCLSGMLHLVYGYKLFMESQQMDLRKPRRF